MFFYSSQNQKLSLRQKIALAVSVVMVLALLFLFGLTFLVIAVVGGLVTFLANLFQGRRKPSIHQSPDSPYPPFRQKRPHKIDDDDDVIDI